MLLGIQEHRDDGAGLCDLGPFNNSLPVEQRDHKLDDLQGELPLVLKDEGGQGIEDRPLAEQAVLGEGAAPHTEDLVVVLEPLKDL